jgi:very-short-patch-repair endonuclease
VHTLTPAQQERFAALTPRERFGDAEFQRWAQSHRSTESLVAEGKLGWAATVRRYGADFAFDRAAQTRRGRPSGPERAMIRLLGEMGHQDQRDYAREYKAAARTYADFAWPERVRIVEVYGTVHFGRFDPDGTRAAYDATREQRLRDLGWSLLVVTGEELRPEQWATTRARVAAFLQLEEGALVSVSRQAMDYLRHLWRR